MKNIIIKKIFKLIIIFSLVNIILLVAVVLTAKKLDNTENAIKEFVSSSENKSFRTEELRAALDKIRETRKEVSEYDNYLFKPGDELDLITKMEKTAEKNKVSLLIVNSNLDQIINNKITLNLSVTGKYIDVLNYLLELESQDYLLTVESLDMIPAGNNKESIKMNIIISIYAE
jgi:Tfp pilus assembly protein PilO